MQIREYQEWLEAWDRARGWERVSLSHTFVHATEELGEVGRLILQWEGYKDMPDPEVWRAQMAEELSDVLVFLIKLAYQCGIDIEDAVQAGRAQGGPPQPRFGGGQPGVGKLPSAPGGAFRQDHGA